MSKVKNLVVGCGISGVTIAERVASQWNQEVLIIDKRKTIGGNLYDYKDDSGITVHKYGPHIFHTSSQQVWNYLSSFTSWHRFFHRVNAYVDGQFVNIPFNLDSLYKVFPLSLASKLEGKLLAHFEYGKRVPILELRNIDDSDLAFLAQYIYDKIFLGYTKKQWGVKPEELDPLVSGRVPILISRDDRYFQDTYTGIPVGGFTTLVKKMLDHPNIHVQLDAHFADVKDELQYGRLFFTGSIDEYFDYCFGVLPYRSLEITFEEYNKPYFQPCAAVNYPNDYDFTRSIEYKYLLDEPSEKTIVSLEYPTAFIPENNERYYPIPNTDNSILYQRYFALTQNCQDVYFLGRLGDYKYYDIDKAVLRALEIADTCTT